MPSRSLSPLGRKIAGLMGVTCHFVSLILRHEEKHSHMPLDLLLDMFEKVKC